jgi:7-cyano-7-deazaguanine synthase in queuosine biosynthesis
MVHRGVEAMSKAAVNCQVYGIRTAFPPRQISFDIGTDLILQLGNSIGPKGLSPTAADLVDLAAAIYQIDRHITSWRGTNPPARIQLSMRLRNPNAWSEQAIRALHASLQLLGNAPWELQFGSGSKAPIPKYQTENGGAINQVALFSGGVDSMCGAITLRNTSAHTRLVSFYSAQKTLQRRLASEIGFQAPVQWRMKWLREPGRGRSFYFRSFLFLVLAGAVAETWDARTVFQFENGILATAVPPTPSWMMTKHAHPLLHETMGELFGALLGGRWVITNPFLQLTKRECVEHAAGSMQKARVMQLLADTETCWYLRSNNVYGGKKRPGMPCGICVPCVLRRTAIPGERYQYNLLDDEIKGHKKRGESFRAYYAFSRKILVAGKSPAKFYSTLPAAGRGLADGGVGLTLSALHRLFRTFAHEFVTTFDLREAK